MAKKLPAPENRLPELVEGAEQTFGEILSTSADQEKDAVLAAGIDLGRIEALDFVLTVSSSAILSVYENVKKSKAWRFLRNPRSSHGENFTSLEEFCEVKLGKSYKRIQAVVGNRNLIGQDAFEQAERLGLRQADYNVIKALPAPKQEIIKEALTDGASKEEVQRALRELAAADQKEIESLTNERDSVKAEHEAIERVLEDKQAKIGKLEKQLAKLQSYTPDQTAAELHKKMVEALGHEMHALHGQIAKVATVVQDVYATGDTTAIDGVNEVVRWAFQSLADVALKHGIEVDFKEIVVPEWMRPMLAGAEATSA